MSVITKEAKGIKTIIQRRLKEVKEDILKVPISVPPPGKCKVVNIFVDPETEKLIVQYDDVPL